MKTTKWYRKGDDLRIKLGFIIGYAYEDMGPSAHRVNIVWNDGINVCTERALFGSKEDALNEIKRLDQMIDEYESNTA